MVTWYKIHHAGGQAYYYSCTGKSKTKQKFKLDWSKSLKLSVWQILYHVIAAKGLNGLPVSILIRNSILLGSGE